MGNLTVNVDFTGRPALLVGAGAVGRRKLADLLAAGAEVTVVEPRPEGDLPDLAARGLIRLVERFTEDLLVDSPWVFVAVDDPAAAAAPLEAARRRGLMVNVADRPADCGFLMPAVADLAPLRLAVTTDGASPALAALIASELRVRYRGHGLLAALLGRLRPAVMASVPDPARRRAVLLALARRPDLPGLLLEGRLDQVRRIAGSILGPADLGGRSLDEFLPGGRPAGGGDGPGDRQAGGGGGPDGFSTS